MSRSRWSGAATHAAAALSGAAAATYLILRSREEDSEGQRRRRAGVPSGGGDDDGDRRPPAMAPASPVTVFRPHPDLEIAYDARTRNPAYVLERLGGRLLGDGGDGDGDPGGGESASRSDMRFAEESSLPPAHRSRNGSYRGSGYDRGHLAPAADFGRDGGAMATTFNLCNASPQVPAFNRGVWSRLEGLVRRVAREEWRDGGRVTYVATGPLWLPSGLAEPPDGSSRDRFRYSHYAIGSPPSIVSVPTHFFKAVAVVTEANDGGGGEGGARHHPRLEKFAAFVLPNEDVPREKAARSGRYLVRLSDLEAVSGMSFFPALFLDGDGAGDGYEGSDRPRKDLIDALTEQIWMEAGRLDASRGDEGSGHLLLADAAISKRRQQKVRKLLRTSSDAGESVVHICSDRRCDDIFRRR